jgi:hypothetical protein
MAVARTEGNCRNSKSGGIGSFFAICFMKKAMPVLCTQAPRRRGDAPWFRGRQGAKVAPATALGAD